MILSERENVSFALHPNNVSVMAQTHLPDDDLCTSAYVLVFHKGRVLMADQDRGIDVPGGHIDPGETPHEAMCREAREETGVIVKSAEIFAVQKIEVFSDAPEDYQYPHPVSYQIFYVCKNFEMGDFIEDEDSSGPVWIDLENKNDVIWFQNHPEVLDAALRATAFPDG